MVEEIRHVRESETTGVEEEDEEEEQEERDLLATETEKGLSIPTRWVLGQTMAVGGEEERSHASKRPGSPCLTRRRERRGVNQALKLPFHSVKRCLIT